MSDQEVVAPSSRKTWANLWQTLRPWLIGLLFVGGASAILLTPIGRTNGEALILSVGDVASFDIIAPRSKTYISDIQTAADREAAKDTVAPIYDPPDTRIARQQVTKAQAALNFIKSVRADSSALPQQKRQDLSYLIDVSPPAATVIGILELNDARWEATQAEVTRVIAEILSSQLREDQIDDARQRIPRLVSVVLSVEEANIVTALASEFIVPNSLFNESATEQARSTAVAAVEPISQAFAQGQTIVGHGQVISELDLEAMQALDLLEPESSLISTYLPPLTAVILVTIIITLYLHRQLPEFANQPRHLILLTLLALAFLFSAKLIVPQGVVRAFLFPAATLGMLVAVGLGTHLGLVVTVLFSVFLALITDGRLDITMYHMIGSVMAILALGKAERVNSYFWAGLAVAAANVAVILILRLWDPTLDLRGRLELLGASAANGAISASLTLMGFFLLGYLFDITTSLQLVELSRSNQPLLVELLRAAPGTYQHSLHVANLAEQAAQRIGANPLLVRVGALYHDIGKSKQPEYFVENQIEGLNPHDQLDPYGSAQIIINHVRDGEVLARRYHLPSAIRAAILEHHGTLPTMYQYQLAVANAGNDQSQVDLSDFTYQGPKPQSRETALLMLADGCDAKSRADRPSSIEEIDEIVRYIVNRRLQQGQLNQCDLSLADLQAVRDSFVNTLKGFFHTRLKYPTTVLPQAALEHWGEAEQTAPAAPV